MPTEPTPSENLRQIIESAHRLGVGMDEEEALQWLTAIASWKQDDAIAMDAASGVFGHKVTLLDFSPADLTYFRQVGELVEFKDEPGLVETALALSGSAAQSKIQTYPGDCDFFERINIIAPTRPEACQVLSRLIRQKALSALKGTTFRLIEVKFGSYPCDVVRDGDLKKAGTPVSWQGEDVRNGFLQLMKTDETPFKLSWEDVQNDPGWCKLDWVVADPVRGRVAYASNMLDITWESPDGEITPLDGYLDPYFQEVYLQAESIPLFSKLIKHVAADALENYVSQLEHEVQKYLKKDPRNYGKVAKRMYNIFRLTGKYDEAAFLRELFNEPATVLYQISTLIDTIEDASNGDSTISIDTILAQVDQLILASIRMMEGDSEVKIVQTLLKLRDSVARHDPTRVKSDELVYIQTILINEVNHFFYERLSSIPSILNYMQTISGEKP